VTAPEHRDDETLEAELVEVDSTVVSLFKDTPAIEAAPEPDFERDDFEPGEYAEYTRSALATRVEAVAARPITPGLDHLQASARWWARALGRSLLWSATHPHRVAGAELRPVGRGIAVSWRAWRKWETEADYAATVVTAPAGSPGHEKAATELAKMRSGHRRLSAVVLLLMLAGLSVMYFIQPLWLILIGVGVFSIFDIVGRRNPVEGPSRVVRRTLLEEGAPLGALATQVIQRLNEENVRADPGGPMTVHAGSEYRMPVVHEDAIEPKHLRSLERHLAARPLSIRLVGTEDSGTSELRLPTRDHLAKVPPREWAPTGSRSISDPADLWVRSDGDPSSPVLEGVHVDMVGTTGSAKSSAIQEMVSFFGECRDVYPVFADLTKGPLGPLNKRVLRRSAYTVDELDALLDWVLARVEERHVVLNRLAESDDPDDDEAPIEWDLSWGPQIELVIDEYSYVARHEELHEKVEEIMRIGRKVRVCVIRASQKSGTKDLGSTLAASLVGLKILLACEEADTTKMLSTGHRDRGWSPHEFRPAVKGDVRDAGKCFVWGPSHRDPEVHRFHTPLEPGEIKRRDRRREADGLPNLDGTSPDERPALLLSPVQVAVEEVFADRGKAWLPTSEISAELAERGFEIKPGPLADELGNCGTKKDWGDRRQIRGYALSDIRRAWGIEE
jgi:hypothetical protein